MCKAFHPIVQSGNNFRKPSHPRSSWTARVAFQRYGVLVAEQALSPRAVETFNNNLVAVNGNTPSPDNFFVVFRLFGNRAQELAPGVNLQQLRLRLL